MVSIRTNEIQKRHFDNAGSISTSKQVCKKVLALIASNQLLKSFYVLYACQFGNLCRRFKYSEVGITFKLSVPLGY